MNWDERWDAVFRAKETWGRYPQEELVRFVAAQFDGSLGTALREVALRAWSRGLA
jgi:hypothetical protein